MFQRFMLSLAPLCLALSSAVAQTPPPPVEPPLAPAPAPLPKPATVRVALQTDRGPIVLELEKARAPVTTANFLRYVDQKRLDGTYFYRAMKMPPDLGIIQGGVRGDPKRVLPAIKHEPTTDTGVTHTDGTISMARAAPGTATADFFITIGAVQGFDAHPEQSGDNLGYAAFGHVVEGMEIVRGILAAPTSATEGAGVMKGQMLAPKIRIISARRVVQKP